MAYTFSSRGLTLILIIRKKLKRKKKVISSYWRMIYISSSIANWKEVIQMVREIILMTGTKYKKTVIATAITTILSATAAFVAIKKGKKLSTANDDLTVEENFKFETVLDGLVKDGTITQIQEDAIQSAIATSKEADIANDDLMREENGEFTTVPGSSKTAFYRIKKTLLKAGSQQLNNKPSWKLEI